MTTGRLRRRPSDASLTHRELSATLGGWVARPQRGTLRLSRSATSDTPRSSPVGRPASASTVGGASRHTSLIDSGELMVGEVVVVAATPAEYRPGSRASVVGLPDERYPRVTIEFGDGPASECPGSPRSSVQVAVALREAFRPSSRTAAAAGAGVKYADHERVSLPARWGHNHALKIEVAASDSRIASRLVCVIPGATRRQGLLAVRSGSRYRSSLAGMEDEVIRALVTRLARPHRSGGEVIERAAIFADSADFAEVMAWITARGGTAEAVVSTARGGLHDQHLDARTAAVAPTPRRFVLPPGALTR